MLRRLVQLYAGLWLYGSALALFVASGLGTAPWDVLHQGLARTIGLSIGTWVIVVGALVLVAWIPLRQRPGLGTVSNVLLIGVALDVTLRLLPGIDALPVRIVLVLAGVVLNAVATAAYIGAGFGPGPRDGLMTGLAARTGRPVAVVRTGLELTVLLAGVLLGGTVGIGTLAYAFGIGPLVQPLLPLLDARPRVPVPGEAGVGTAASAEPCCA